MKLASQSRSVFKRNFMKKTVNNPNDMKRLASNIFLHLLLFIAVAGCAPLMHNVASLSGGGSGSTCEFSGLLRGSNCVRAIPSVYLSDERWRDRPRVCGSLTTWGKFGNKDWRAGEECFDDLPTYCQSNILIPGFDNQTVKNHDVEMSAQLEKKNLCSLPMTAQLLLYKGTTYGSTITAIWSNAVLTNAYGKIIRIEEPGDDMATYCRSSMLVPGVGEQMLKDYGILKEAISQKAKLCDVPR